MRSLLVLILPLVLVAPITAAPLATSTPVTIPGVMTATMGFVGPSEVPNPHSLNLSPLNLPPPKLPVRLPIRDGLLQRRQIRIANHDIGPNVTQQNPVSALEEPSLLSKRMSAEMADEATRLESQVADSAPDAASAPNMLERRQIRIANHDIGPNMTHGNPISALEDPSLISKRASKSHEKELGTVPGGSASNSNTNTNGAPQQPGISSATKAVSTGLQALGAARTNSSAAVHDALGQTFDSDAEGSSPNLLHNVVANARRDTSTPEHPRIGLAVAYEQPMKPTKRHTFVVDTDALLPDSNVPDSTVANAKPTPIQAWQQMGLLNIDSNRPPMVSDLPALPKNLTMVNGTTSNLTQADTQTPLQNVTHA